MDIFGNDLVNLSFDKATMKLNKAGDKVAKFSFAAVLTPENVLASPHYIQAAYEAVETRHNGITRTDLADLELEDVNIAFLALPQAEKPSLRLAAVTLVDLRVERNSSRHVETRLCFSLEIKLDENNTLKLWMVDYCFMQMWARFENAQPSLVEQAVADFVKPIAESDGISSVTLSAGGKSVTVDKETAQKIRKSADKKVQ